MATPHISTDGFEKLIRESVSAVIGHRQPKAGDVGGTSKITASTTALSAVKKIISEAVVLMPKAFTFRSESQSPTTKENHENLYNRYVESFNKISAKLDTVSRDEADNPNNSEFRRLKIDENHNMNGVKFHELYFANSGDTNSQIRADSIPFMRLNRDWGTFDAWQLDFRACAMSATEGWAVCYFDPFKQRYFNCFVEKHDMYLPLLGIPVVVLDTWHHAWFYDFPEEKISYVNRSMVELNWSVIEMRMLAAEMAKLHQIYSIQPVPQATDNNGDRSSMVQSLPPVTAVM